MLTKLLNVKYILLICHCLLAVNIAVAEEKSDHQIHFREGLIKGSYDGVISNELESQTILDMEYEVFLANRKSYYFRTTLGMDFDKNIIDYSYLGGGMRYYFSSKGMFFNTIKRGTGIQSRPRWRFYVSWAVGTSTVVLQTLGEFLQVNSSTVELGGNIGTIFQIYKNIGIEAQYSFDVSTGFTSISVGGSVHKATLGLTYFF